MSEQTKKEIQDLVWWIDRFAKLRNPKEINFIADMIDEPPNTFSPAQTKWIKDIYDRDN